MTLTDEQIRGLIDCLATIPYFPGEAGSRRMIADEVARFVEDGRKLRWLVDNAVNRMTAWKGIAELRALYCASYRPYDGIEGGTCSVAGFTPAECETIKLTAHGDHIAALRSAPDPVGLLMAPVDPEAFKPEILDTAAKEKRAHREKQMEVARAAQIERLRWARLRSAADAERTAPQWLKDLA